VRELREELNLKGKPVLLLGTSPSMTKEYELFWVELAVEDLSALEPRTEEVAEVRWIEPGGLQELEPLIPGAVEGFRDFLGGDWAGGQKRRPSR
jgi:8-oxo-dGTP pyrophosphatase MutT (NUDIX family)